MHLAKTNVRIVIIPILLLLVRTSLLAPIYLKEYGYDMINLHLFTILVSYLVADILDKFRIVFGSGYIGYISCRIW